MRLHELEASFVKREIRPCGPGPNCNVTSPHTEHEYHVEVDSIAEADGVRFRCPTCVASGFIGVHGILCWRPRVPLGTNPGPGRWEFQGTSLDDLTLVAGASSIKLDPPCAAHFYVRNGEIVAA